MATPATKTCRRGPRLRAEDGAPGADREVHATAGREAGATVSCLRGSAKPVDDLLDKLPAGCPQSDAITSILFRDGGYSSRSRSRGSTDRARRAGIHAAMRPSSSMVTLTPPSTSGSLGVAW